MIYYRNLSKYKKRKGSDKVTEDKVKEFKQLVDKSNNIVFFGGAGVSTESGIPDFRSKDGLYNQKYKYPPEEILSHTFFMDNTEEFKNSGGCLGVSE